MVGKSVYFFLQVMNKRRPTSHVTFRAVTTGLVLCVFMCGVLYPESFPRTSGSGSEKPAPTPRPRSRNAGPARYSRFPHKVKAHQVECSNCHKFPSDNWQKVRPGDAGFPDITDYPKHESCLNCHRVQFFKGAKPAICSVCHTNPSPRNSMRHAFPNPREIFDTTVKGKTAVSDFVVSFPHDKHIEIVSRKENKENGFTNAAWSRPAARAEESCSVCHQTYRPQVDSEDEFVTKRPADLGDAFWLKKGTFKTAPVGHTTCFTCHSADTGISPAPTDCATCHKLKILVLTPDVDEKTAAKMALSDKIMLTAWRRRTSSGTFRHEWFSHTELSCSTCHNVAAIKTDDPATTKVSITSCSACHVTATSDEGGALNFEIDARKTNTKFQCVKCHIAFGKSALPESHLKAIESAK